MPSVIGTLSVACSAGTAQGTAVGLAGWRGEDVSRSLRYWRKIRTYIFRFVFHDKNPFLVTIWAFTIFIGTSSVPIIKFVLKIFDHIAK